MPAPPKPLRSSLVISLSLLIHGALVAIALQRGALNAHAASLRAFSSPLPSVCTQITRHIEADQQRRALVAEALVQRQNHTLQLGTFLLHASVIDAAETGRTLDGALLEKLYRERVKGLKAAIVQEGLRWAVADTFGDLRYFGRPGGLMADLLLDLGGSCEQLSQLIAATVFDAGYPAWAAVRYYGGAMSSGASHMAPVAGEGAAEIDLVRGGPAFPKGVRLPAADLVEVYARAHGLLPARADLSGSASPSPASPAAATLAAGFPANDDRYPGSLPLFAARAVSAPHDGADSSEAQAELRTRAEDCALFVPVAILDPPTIDKVSETDSPQRVEIRKNPTPGDLSRRSTLLRVASDLAQAPTSDLTTRIMAEACRTALGQQLAIDFALVGETELSSLAAAEAQTARLRGKTLINEADSQAMRADLSSKYAGQTWLLLVLPGGDRLLVDLVEHAKTDDWGAIDAASALIIAPATRARGLAILSRMARRDRIDVMHELFHTHDQLRPWTSSYGFEVPRGLPPEVGETLRVYAVFRRLSARLWEAQRPVAETLKALADESQILGLDREWQALLLEYYGRNVLGLYQNRADGMAALQLVDEAIGKNGHPLLEVLHLRLMDIDAKGKIDAVTLSDAWRIR